MAEYLGGYIKNGKYVPRRVDPTELRTSDNSRYKASDHDRQRKDFAKEIIQPYTPDGSVNEDFVNAYPEEAREYGFLPTIDKLKEQQ